MTTDEEQDEGQVSFRVYWAYFKAGSGLLAVVILIVLSAAEAMNQWQQVYTPCCAHTLLLARLFYSLLPSPGEACMHHMCF